MAGIDPRLAPFVDQANATLGYGYRVPVNTVQPLTPEEQAIGQMQAMDAAAVDAQVAANPAHAEVAPPAPQPFASIPLGWTPGAQAPQQPTAQVQQQELQPAPAPTPTPRPGAMGAGVPVGGGGATGRLLSSMATDAGQRREAAEKMRDSAAIEADIAREDLKLSAEQLGETRSDVAGEISGVRADVANFEKEQRQQLFDAADAKEKALKVKESEQKELSRFMQENREPKDRRSWGQKIVGALAVALGGLADQANLAAGLNIGMNVQTDNAGRAMALIDRAIQRDLDAQREMLANARTEYAAKNTEMGQIREKYGDRVDAYKLAAATKYGQAQNEIEAAIQRGMSEEHKVVAQQTIAEIELKKNALLEDMGNTAADREYKREQDLKLMQAQRTDAAAAARARAQQPMSEQERLKLDEQRLKNEKLRQELGGGAAELPGLRPRGDARPSERSADMAQDIVSNTEGFRAVLGQLSDFAREGGSASPTKRRQAELALGALKSQFNLVLGDKSAANEAQLAMMEDLVANPAEYTFADMEKVFQGLDDLAVRTTQGKVAGYGFDYQPAPVVRRGAAR